MAILVKTNGEIEYVSPQNNSDFSLSELQKFVSIRFSLAHLACLTKIVQISLNRLKTAKFSISLFFLKNVHHTRPFT